MKNRILIALSLVVVLALCLGVACSAATVNFDPNGAVSPNRTDQLAPDVITVYGTYDDGFVLNNDTTYPEEYDVLIDDGSEYGDNESLRLWGVIDDTFSEDYLHHVVEYNAPYNYIYYTYKNLSPTFAYSGAPGSSFGYDPVYYGYTTYYQYAPVDLSVDISLSWYDDDGDIQYHNFVTEGEVSTSTTFTCELVLASAVEVAIVDAGFVPGSISPERNLRVEYIDIGFYCGTGFDDTFSYTTCDLSSAGFDVYSPPESLNVSRPVVNPDIFGWLKDSVQCFLDTPVFGSDITFSSVLGLLIAVPIVIWFLKMVAGG